MRYKLSQLNNITMEVKNNKIILWITHDKNFNYGWYYLFDNNKLYLIYDTEITYEEHLIKDFGDNNDK